MSPHREMSAIQRKVGNIQADIMLIARRRLPVTLYTLVPAVFFEPLAGQYPAADLNPKCSTRFRSRKALSSSARLKHEQRRQNSERTSCIGILARLALTLLGIVSLAGQAADLNDTGQTACYDASGTVVSCNLYGQDGRFGRDAAVAAGVLTKIGAGAAGFDYTKVANDGSDLAADAVLGSNPTDWGCTRDNVTSLTWEIKTPTSTDRRYSGHHYSWYSTAANNGGNSGSVGTNTCNSTLGGIYANQCNTSNYVLAIKAAALPMCGYNDWRLPTIRELQTLIHSGASSPSIATSYFPNTQSGAYFSASNYAADPAKAWLLDFFEGAAFGFLKSAAFYVRLVRGGP